MAGTNNSTGWVGPGPQSRPVEGARVRALTMGWSQGCPVGQGAAVQSCARRARRLHVSCALLVRTARAASHILGPLTGMVTLIGTAVPPPPQLRQRV